MLIVSFQKKSSLINLLLSVQLIVLGPEHKERMIYVKNVVRPALIKFLKHCIDHCKFTSKQIMLFGFSQGGQIALDLAAFGGLQLNGVLSIAGYMMEESEKDEPAIKLQTTKVLVMQGDKDDVRTVKASQDKVKHLERIFGKANVSQLVVDGMGHGMPHSEVRKESPIKRNASWLIGSLLNIAFYSRNVLYPVFAIRLDGGH